MDWSGLFSRHSALVQKEFKTQIFFVGPGWFQEGGFQVDSGGIDILASWSLRPKLGMFKNERVNVKARDVLLVAQSEEDPQFLDYSPWFRSAYDFISHFGEASPHPTNVWLPRQVEDREAINLLIANTPHLRIVTGDLNSLIDAANVVVTVNEPKVIRAIDRHKPVLCYGHAFYRHERVVYCMDDSVRVTDQVLSRIFCTGTSDLLVDAQANMAQLARDQEWSRADAPTRLSGLLG